MIELSTIIPASATPAEHKVAMLKLVNRLREEANEIEQVETSLICVCEAAEGAHRHVTARLDVTTVQEKKSGRSRRGR